MKVRFYCNSGANAFSRRKEEFDTVTDLGLAEGEWEGMTDEERYAMAEEWANQCLEIGYEEVQP